MSSQQPDGSAMPPLGGRISCQRTHDPRTPATAVLSPRERDVVCLLVKGLRNKEIAARLRIRERTVKFHLGRIFDKLGVDSRIEVLLLLAEEGLLRSSESCPSDDWGTIDRRLACWRRDEEM